MKPEQRQDQIVARLRALQAELSVEELADLFQVSSLTIRRDLDQLESAGTILRTHGGCILRSIVGSVYHRKVALNFDQKRAIGKAAASEVLPDATILINDGSTPFHLASQLGDRGKLSVYTNSLAVVSELSRSNTIDVWVLGGQYDSELHFMGGSLTIQVLETLFFDSVFLGADAIDAQGNCLVSDPDIARITKAMLRRGKRKVLLADHTKVGGIGHAVYARLSDLDVWYTTPGIPAPLLRKYRRMTSVKITKP